MTTPPRRKGVILSRDFVGARPSALVLDDELLCCQDPERCALSRPYIGARERRQGPRVACPKEIASRSGCIDAAQQEKPAAPMRRG